MLPLLPLLPSLLLLAACGGGSPDEGARLSDAAQRGLTEAPAAAPPDTASAAAADPLATAAAEGVIEGEAPESAGTPPVAPHPTRLVMLEDGLYARDAGDNWKKYENGSWVSVHAPQLPSGMQ
ncbi:hypothetical protein FX016_01060 [Cupriavidus gilardii]|nr:hypothetical protein FX016_01060 [Cupriavidus gilardii]